MSDMKKTKMLVVRGENAAIRARNLFPEWDVRSLGSMLCGAGFDLIVIACEPIDQRDVDVMSHLKTKLFPGGKFLFLNCLPDRPQSSVSE